MHGEQVNFNSPKDAIDKGIGMVHQHFMLVPVQTVTENILLGLDTPRFFMNLNKLDEEIVALQEQFGLQVDPEGENLAAFSGGAAAGGDSENALSWRRYPDSG